jgi:hypothetical protein
VAKHLTTSPQRPVVLGYVRAQLTHSRAELAETVRRLAEFAEREGYTLGKVFTERADTAPTTYHALIAAALKHGVTAVVVPNLGHLTVLGDRPTLKGYLERRTDALVLVADDHVPVLRSA